MFGIILCANLFVAFAATRHMIKYIRNQKGVSIIEILVVVAIIAIVVGMILPSYFRLKPTIRINGAARQIMGDLMWAKMKAVSENNNYVVVFGEAGPDLTNNTYTIYDDNENDFDSANIDASESVKKAVIPNQNKMLDLALQPAPRKLIT